MGRFLIFVAVVLVFFAIGLGVWWMGNKIWISIQRDNGHFEIEKEGFEVAKDAIKNDVTR